MLGHARGLFLPVSVYEHGPLSAELEGGTFGKTRLRRGSHSWCDATHHRHISRRMLAESSR